MPATDTFYRGGSARMDCTDLNLTGAVSVDGAAAITGAISATGGLLVNGSVAVSTGTTPSIPAASSFFYGSQNSSAVVLPNAASYAGRMLYIYEAGTGTMTLTGYGSQTWNGVGTGTITPTKYTWLVSDGSNWRSLITSL